MALGHFPKSAVSSAGQSIGKRLGNSSSSLLLVPHCGSFLQQLRYVFHGDLVALLSSARARPVVERNDFCCGRLLCLRLLRRTFYGLDHRHSGAFWLLPTACTEILNGARRCTRGHYARWKRVCQTSHLLLLADRIGPFNW